MNEIKIFENPDFGNVRITSDADGNFLFCLADVCSALGLSNANQVKKRLREKGISLNDTLTDGGVQQLTYVDESNLYRCIFQCRKKKNALRFQDWIFEEVLPSIRKTGGYMVTKEEDTDELIMARAFMIAKDTIDRKERKIRELEVIKHNQQRQIGTMQSKADFYDTIMGSEKTVEMKDVAKILDMGIGRNNLFRFLREHKVLDNHNCPYQMYVDKRWFKSIPIYFDDPATGKPSIYLKTVVYPHGINGIRQLLKDKGFIKNRAQGID